MNGLENMQKTILVVGDVMVDYNCYCGVNRISPEGPFPVLEYEKSEGTLGGAANVAENLSANGQLVDVMGVIGDDEDGKLLIDLLNEAGILNGLMLKDNSRSTTCKIRFLSKGQQLFRLDKESTDDIPTELEKDFISLLEKNIDKYNIVIISDYLKGMVTYTLSRYVISLCKKHGIPVLIDPKDSNIEKYKGCTLLKPNKKGFKVLLNNDNLSDDDLLEKAVLLKEKVACDFLVVTLGKDGMIFVDENNRTTKIASEGKEIFDVTGAGDTVMAFLTMGFRDGIVTMEDINCANMAAGLKVGKLGTAVVKKEELIHRKYAKNKLISLNQAEQISKILRDQNKKIVFTNGCFDIIHQGHVEYLRAARKKGDVLIIGINSDSSIKRLKGEERPVFKEEERLSIIKSLECVDYVVVFEQDTPLELIEKIKPDVLVKGGDYKKEEIVGYDVVKAYGGKTIVLPYLEGKSTTNIIDKIISGRNKVTNGEG